MSTYKELAEYYFNLFNGVEENNCSTEEQLKSIISAFYNIENELLKYLGINCKIYTEEEKIELIDMIYKFKNLYYSKYEIISFFSKIKKVDYSEVDLVDEFYKQSNFMRSKKIFDALNICKDIMEKEEDFHILIKNIEKLIPSEEKSIIKNISQYKISEVLEEDLKRYYFLKNIIDRYAFFIDDIKNINLNMSIKYRDLLSKLRTGFMNKNVRKENKEVVYNALVNHFKQKDLELDKLIEKSKNKKTDLMSTFYIRISAVGICKILRYEEKLLQMLQEQYKLLELSSGSLSEDSNNYKITNIVKDIIKTKPITKSQIRTFQNNNKNIVPIIRDKYKKQFNILKNNEKKIIRLILREVYIDNKSKGNKNYELRKIKKDCDLESIKLSKIIKELNGNLALNNNEKIFIDTLIDRGIILEKGIIDYSIIVNEIDVIVSKIIRKVYLLNDLIEIQEFLYGLFNI